MKTKVSPGGAAEAWSNIPARGRKMVIDFFHQEAKQSDVWADDPPGGETSTEHREDARALRAAVKLLRSAQRGAR